MKVISIHEAPKEPFTHPEYTGTNGTREDQAPGSRERKVSMVNSGEGLRNKLHARDGEQILIVITGKGIVATEREERIVNEGDVIFIPPGVTHWHGASTHVEFSHVLVTPPNGGMTKQGD